MTTSPWMLAFSGREHTLAGAGSTTQDNAPTLGEIAHSLAQINRFNGHAERPYSVAEHSLLVCDIVRGRGGDCHAQLAALLHDAHEAFTGDAATPIKWVLGAAWFDFEHPQQRLLQRTFCIISASTAHRALIKTADLIALATERRDLLPWTPAHRPWPVLDTPGSEIAPLHGTDLMSPLRIAMPWQRHRDAFATRANLLIAACNAPRTEPAAAPQ